MLELISGYNEILVRQLTEGVSRHECLNKVEFLPDFMHLTPPVPRDQVEVKISPLGAFKNCYLDEYVWYTYQRSYVASKQIFKMQG